MSLFCEKFILNDKIDQSCMSIRRPLRVANRFPDSAHGEVGGHLMLPLSHLVNPGKAGQLRSHSPIKPSTNSCIVVTFMKELFFLRRNSHCGRGQKARNISNFQSGHPNALSLQCNRFLSKQNSQGLLNSNL